jgi:hypothetical protein
MVQHSCTKNPWRRSFTYFNTTHDTTPSSNNLQVGRKLLRLSTHTKPTPTFFPLLHFCPTLYLGGLPTFFSSPFPCPIRLTLGSTASNGVRNLIPRSAAFSLASCFTFSCGPEHLPGGVRRKPCLPFSSSCLPAPETLTRTTHAHTHTHSPTHISTHWQPPVPWAASTCSTWKVSHQLSCLGGATPCLVPVFSRSAVGSCVCGGRSCQMAKSWEFVQKVCGNPCIRTTWRRCHALSTGMS